LRPDRVALVHDRLEQNGGAERVLWALHKIFPGAPIFTTIWDRQAVPRFETCDVRTSWMQELPGILRAPRAYAALYPLAFRAMKLHDFDLVISTTSSFAQGIRTNGALHVCYCHSPANFVWRPEAYFHGAAMRRATIPLRTWLKVWDRQAAAQPDVYVATGQPVAERIGAFYRRDAAIIAPPIEGRWFTAHQADEFFLFAGRLVPHKHADLAIAGCAELGLPLVVAGTGRSADQLRKTARGPTRFLGYVSDDELRTLYTRARAVIVPSEEEFGLVSLEAQAAGTPVIAYDAGGSRETVVDGVTGVRFSPQTAAGVVAGIRRFSQLRWNRDAIQRNAARFGQDRFEQELLVLIEGQLEGRSGAFAASLRRSDAV
jgi:glycosyltransferase involved in cell wall biosynthesis